MLITGSKARSEISQELRTKVEAVIEKFHTAFPEVDINRMAFVRCTTSRKRALKIMPVKIPYDGILSQKFIMVSYGKKFDDLDPARQNMNIFRELMRIEDFESGKLEDYQIKDFPEILEKYGNDWENDDNLIDIVNENEDEAMV